MKSLLARAAAEDRALTVVEDHDFQKLERKAGKLLAEAGELESDWKRLADGVEIPGERSSNKTLLRSSDRIVDFYRDRQVPDDRNLPLRSVGDCVRQWLDTGRKEYRITTSSHSAIASQFVFARFADLFRSKSVFVQAGGMTEILGGEYTQWKLPKLTGDVTAAWRAESGSISQSTCTVSAVTWTPKSLSALLKVSREALADVNALNDIIEGSFAGAFALAVDKAAVGFTTGANQPTGIMLTTSVNSTAVNAPITSWTPLSNAVQRLLEDNVPVGTESAELSAILGTRDFKAFGTLRSTGDSHVLERDPLIRQMRLFDTSAVTLTTAGHSKAVVGNWQYATLGLREELTLLILDERYAETGDIGIVGHMRADLQVVQPSAFEILAAITT